MDALGGCGICGGVICRCSGATGEMTGSHLLKDGESPFGGVPRVPTVKHVEFTSVNVCKQAILINCMSRYSITAIGTIDSRSAATYERDARRYR